MSQQKDTLPKQIRERGRKGERSLWPHTPSARQSFTQATQALSCALAGVPPPVAAPGAPCDRLLGFQQSPHQSHMLHMTVQDIKVLPNRRLLAMRLHPAIQHLISASRCHCIEVVYFGRSRAQDTNAARAARALGTSGATQELSRTQLKSGTKRS